MVKSEKASRQTIFLLNFDYHNRCPNSLRLTAWSETHLLAGFSALDLASCRRGCTITTKICRLKIIKFILQLYRMLTEEYN